MVLIVFLIVIAAASGALAGPSSVWDSVPDSVVTPGDTLSFTDVLVRIKRASPALRALPLRATAASALIEQAGAWLYSHESATAENVAGSYSGLDQSEFSLWFSQEFELGGKRSRRVDHAARVADEIDRETRDAAFDVYLTATSRYAAVVHAEERARLANEAEAIVAELARAAGDRVRAGAALIADAALADAALARVRLSIDAADAERLRARVALATLWGQPLGFNDAVSRAFPLSRARPSADSTQTWAQHSPAVEQARLARASRRADTALEKSLRVPNLTLDAGARRVEADNASTFLFGVGLPLPLWDRRAAAIRAAEAREQSADIESERVQAIVTGELAGHIGVLDRLGARLQQTETTLLPSLTAALENMRTAYAIGRVSYSDLLEVQRTVLGLQHDLNDARHEIVETTIAIERLTGRTIEELMSNE